VQKDTQHAKDEEKMMILLVAVKCRIKSMRQQYLETISNFLGND
jgi:hypothetical protein